MLESKLSYDVINLIFEYMSHLNDMYWTPFIDNKTGRITWKINKYSSKLKMICDLFEHKIYNLRCETDISIEITRMNNLLESKNLKGNIVLLKKESIIEGYYYVQIDNGYDIINIFFNSEGISSISNNSFDVYINNHIYGSLCCGTIKYNVLTDLYYDVEFTIDKY